MEQESPRGPRGGLTTITPGGKIRKSILLNPDEEEALRDRAYRQRVTESSLVREALRTFLGLN